MIIPRHVTPTFLCVLLLFAGLAPPLRADSSLPMFFTAVKKKDARYDTPEQAVIARISSLVHRDIYWYFETQTPETQKIQKKLYEKAGMDPRVSFKLMREGTKYLIADSERYKDGVIVTTKGLYADGSIRTGASLTQKVNGQWKLAYPSVDDTVLMNRLQKSLDYIKPDEILSAVGRIIPSSLGRTWFAEGDSATEKADMDAPRETEALTFCVLGNITAHDGTPLTPDAVHADTLLANHVARPCHVAILDTGRVWRKPRLRMYDGAVLLCAFHQDDILKSRGHLESETEITLFGRMKDGTPFLANARK